MWLSPEFNKIAPRKKLGTKKQKVIYFNLIKEFLSPETGSKDHS